MYAPEPVSSEELGKWQGLIEHHANRYAKLNRDLAEYDDLVQVGLIRVWHLRRRGQLVSETSIRHAMVDELRRVGSPGADRTVIPDDLDLEFLALDGAEL